MIAPHVVDFAKEGIGVRSVLRDRQYDVTSEVSLSCRAIRRS